jgi:lipopolysaccharide export LptBFGC system permease protein LptF
MNNEPPRPNGPEQQREPIPKWAWLLGALSPAALMMLVLPFSNYDNGGAIALKFVALVLNPLITLVSSYGLLSKPNQSKVIPIVGGLFLGVIFAVINIVIAAFAGCVAGGAGLFR